MNDGWIIIHRQILDWEWWQDSEMVHLFLYLLLAANHQPNKWMGVEIGRGQLVCSYDKLSENIGLSVQSVRTRIKRLKSTGEITINSTNRFSVITICNYETYQNTKRRTNKQITNGLTNNQQTTNKQLTTNNKDNNDNNENKHKKRVFVPPTLEEVKKYIHEHPKYSNVNPETFFEYFTETNWIKSTGDPVLSWKGQIITWSGHKPPAVVEDISCLVCHATGQWFQQDEQGRKKWLCGACEGYFERTGKSWGKLSKSEIEKIVLEGKAKSKG